MQRPKFLLPVFLAVLMAVTSLTARADTVFVYDLSSDPGLDNSPGYSALSGSITLTGNPGDAFPLLDGAGVTGFSFTMQPYASSSYIYFTWTNSDTISQDNVTFDGTLGASTLTPVNGQWQIGYNNGNDWELYLASPLDSFEGVSWILTENGNYSQYGESWTLTLASETSSAPEPATFYLLLCPLGVLALWRWRRGSADLLAIQPHRQSLREKWCADRSRRSRL
jgi:hypothetical protein